jgi:rhodanese-related sulfurtransferase
MRKVSVWALVMLVSLSLAVSGVAWAGKEPLKVDIDTVKSWLSDPQVLIVDVRTNWSWRMSDKKIQGAVRQNPNKVKTWAASLPKDKKIVLY